nr:MAG TPA: hypothetical protein [Caudoviricetes sp.]
MSGRLFVCKVNSSVLRRLKMSLPTITINH